MRVLRLHSAAAGTGQHVVLAALCSSSSDGRRAMWAVIPVKRFELAKQRLAQSLPPATRAALAEAMLEDVLAALAAVPELQGRLIISQEPRVRALAARHNCTVLDEASDSDLCHALEQAALHLEREGVEGILIVPGDVPLLQAATVSALLRAHKCVTVVPDREGVGTNCLIVSPPRAIAFQFGVDSARAHRQAALERGLNAVVREMPELALDIDSADDLRELQQRGAATRTQAVLDAWSQERSAQLAPATEADPELDSAGLSATRAGATKACATRTASAGTERTSDSRTIGLGRESG